MRTLRPFLVGAVTLALLAGLGGSVVAQSSEPEVGTGPVHEWVTPVSRACEDLLQSSIEGADITGAGAGFGWWRHYVYRCREVLSDPRVSGDLIGDFNNDCWGAWPSELCVYWGTEELVGPDGTWTGAYHGTMKGTAQTSYKVMTGSGDYEGLTFIWHGSGELGSVDGHGFIYECAPPPMPAE